MRVQKKTKRVLYWGITLVLMILIFSFSAKNGTSSAGMSIGYAKELARILSFFGFFQIHSNADLMMHAEAVHTFVRKTAHFTEYAVLGFFTYKAVSCDVKDRKKAVLIAQLISTGYASTDEIHQLFVPGREGKVFDVMIDSCGAFCGIMVSMLTQKLIEKKTPGIVPFGAMPGFRIQFHSSAKRSNHCLFSQNSFNSPTTVRSSSAFTLSGNWPERTQFLKYLISSA